MGRIKDATSKVANKAAHKALEHETKEIKNYLEAVGAYLELMLETNREILNEVREQRGKTRLEFDDELQKDS